MTDKHLYRIGPLLINVSAGGFHVAWMRQGRASWWKTVTFPLVPTAGTVRRTALRAMYRRTVGRERV